MSADDPARPHRFRDGWFCSIPPGASWRGLGCLAPSGGLPSPFLPAWFVGRAAAERHGSTVSAPRQATVSKNSAEQLNSVRHTGHQQLGCFEKISRLARPIRQHKDDFIVVGRLPAGIVLSFREHNGAVRPMGWARAPSAFMAFCLRVAIDTGEVSPTSPLRKLVLDHALTIMSAISLFWYEKSASFTSGSPAACLCFQTPRFGGGLDLGGMFKALSNEAGTAFCREY